MTLSKQLALFLLLFAVAVAIETLPVILLMDFISSSLDGWLEVSIYIPIYLAPVIAAAFTATLIYRLFRHGKNKIDSPFKWTGLFVLVFIISAIVEAYPIYLLLDRLPLCPPDDLEGACGYRAMYIFLPVLTIFIATLTASWLCRLMWKKEKLDNSQSKDTA